MMHHFLLLLLSSWNLLFVNSSNHTTDKWGRSDEALCTRKCIGYSRSEDKSSGSSRSLCQCDSLCQRFRDCCQNFPRNFPVFRYEWPNFTCRQVSYGGVYELTSCPLYWPGPESIRKMCESSDRRDVKDPLSSAPVTNPVSSLTYKNVHCAVCNGETLENLIFWNVHFGIPGLTRYNLSYGNVSANYAKDALTFNVKTGKWGLALWVSQKKSSVFFDAYVWFDINEDLYRKTRSCIPHTISSCQENWTDESQSKLCEEYLDPHLLQNSNGMRIYRNSHCAMCNGERPETLSCFRTKRGTLRRGTAYFVAFDINAENHHFNRNRPQNDKCDYGHIYDPFIKKCRTLPESTENV